MCPGACSLKYELNDLSDDERSLDLMQKNTKRIFNFKEVNDLIKIYNGPYIESIKNTEIIITILRSATIPNNSNYREFTINKINEII